MDKLLIALYISSICFNVKSEDDLYWRGRIFPTSYDHEKLSTDDLNTLRKYFTNEPVMGVPNPDCDNGKDPHGFDGDLSEMSYTCFDNKTDYLPNKKVHPLHQSEMIPKAYVADHTCMHSPIKYYKKIPTYGTHRPLWPKYGEYTLVPPQRWIHNLEHGAIVLLYHPCADKNELNILRKIVMKCLYKYIITSYDQLSSERPFALVAWGHSLEISKVYPEMAVDFIRSYAHKAYETTNNNGQYDLNLIVPSTTRIGTELCPEDYIKPTYNS